MNIYDYIVIGAVALALAAAVVCMIKKRGSGGCSGCPYSGSCGGSGCERGKRKNKVKRSVHCV